MPFCNKCGLELSSEDVFCPGCGTKVEIGFAEVPSASPSPTVTPSAPYMTKEESIELAEKLKKEYGNIERIQKEINDNNEIISKPVPPAARHSALKFFWPYVVGAAVAANAGWILGLFLLASTGKLGILSTLTVIGIITAIVLTIVGAVTSRNKRSEINYSAELAVKDRHKRQQELKDKNNELKNRLTTSRKRLEKYNDLVPREFRTSRHMDRVRMLIVSGKADDFSGAVNSLYNDNRVR